jgi:hypothetical protein
MANSPANIQAAALIPAMMRRSGGRHRRKRTRKVVLSHQSERSYSAEPKVFPPHAPLLSGGWYRQQSPSERPGPGRYPLDDHADRSVAVALALGLLGGPIGLCYTSVPGGLTCLALMGIGLLLIGFAALPVGWVLAIAWAGISASRRHQRHQRH